MTIEGMSLSIFVKFHFCFVYELWDFFRNRALFSFRIATLIFGNDTSIDFVFIIRFQNMVICRLEFKFPAYK